MKFGKKKEEPVTRQPHFDARRQAAFHYSSNRSPSEKSQRGGEAKKSKLSILKTIVKDTVFVSAVLALAAAAVIFSIITADAKVKIPADQPPMRDSYQSSAADIASSGITSRSKLTLNRNKVSNELQAKYPEIISANISTPIFGRGPNIQLQLSKPAVLLASNNKQYVIDNRGVAVFENNASDNIVNQNDLIKVEDATTATVALGKPALTSSQVTYLTELKRQSKEKNLTIESIDLLAGGGELAVKFNQLNYRVKFNTYEDIRKSFGTFIAAREQAEKNKLKPSEYIDVRVPERAYIK